MVKEDFQNNENHSRLWDRIDKNIQPAGAATGKGDWPPSIRSDQPRDANAHNHRAAATISPAAKAEMAAAQPGMVLLLI